MARKIVTLKTTLPRHWLILAAGSLSALAYIWLAINSQYYGDASLWQLYAVVGPCFFLSVLVFIHYWLNDEPFPVGLMLGFAVLFRLIGLNTYPLLEDDIFRFLWDGRMSVETGTPYGIAPAEFFNAEYLPENFDSVLGAINNPAIATIYGPLCQWAFAAAYLIAPGEIWPLQLIFGLADLGVILLLLRLAKPQFVLLYAWSPLVVKEFVITAHPDVLGVMFMVAAFLACKHRSFILAGVMMALACGVKIFALMLLPFLLGFHWRAYLAFAITAIVIAAPFGVIEAWFPTGLAAMSGGWLFNAPVYLALLPWVSLSTLKLVLVILLALGCAAYLLYFLHRGDSAITVRGDLLFAALFLATPALNAWYLVWLLPFAVLYPSIWAWTASLSIFLAYASGINLQNPSLGSYDIPLWVVLLEVGVVMLAALLQPAITKKFARLKSRLRT